MKPEKDTIVRAAESQRELATCRHGSQSSGAEKSRPTPMQRKPQKKATITQLKVLNVRGCENIRVERALEVAWTQHDKQPAAVEEAHHGQDTLPPLPWEHKRFFLTASCRSDPACTVS